MRRRAKGPPPAAPIESVERRLLLSVSAVAQPLQAASAPSSSSGSLPPVLRAATSTSTPKAAPAASAATRAAAAPTIRWINPAGGDWNVAKNWSTGVVPGPNDDVLISVAGGATVTCDTNATIHSLTSDNPFTVLGLRGGTLTVTGTVQVNNTFTLGTSARLKGATVLAGTGGQGMTVNGASVLDGLTVNAPMSVTGGSHVAVLNGLTLNGTATVTESSLNFAGTQTLGGTGTVRLQTVLDASGAPDGGSLLGGGGGGTFTIGPGVTVRADGGGANPILPPVCVVGPNPSAVGDTSLVIQGTVVCDTAGTGITLASGGAGTVTNAGAINLSAGSLGLGGNLTPASLGKLSRTGGRVYLTGTFANAGNTLDLGAGGWVLAGGTIRGGTLTAPAGSSLTLNGAGGTLDGVTVNCPLDDVAVNSYAHIANGLTLNSTATVAPWTRLLFDGTQTLGGTGTVVFQGQGPGTSGLIANTDAMTLTIGPGITVRGGGTRGNTAYNSIVTADETATIGYNGFYGGGRDSSLVLQGTVSADASSGAGIYLYAGDPGGTGTLTNTGTIRAPVGTVTLAGNYTTAGLGHIDATGGGGIYLQGALNNRNASLNIDPSLGPIHLSGGTISGGTLNETGGAELAIFSSTLDGLRMNGPLDLTGPTNVVTVTNGLVLNGTATLGPGTVVSLVGTQSWTGTGTIVFQDGTGGLEASTDGMTFTVGPAITIRGGTNGSVNGDIGSSGPFGGDNVSLFFQGKILADVPGKALRLYTNGTGTFTNAAAVTVSPGATLIMGNVGGPGGVRNTGSIQAGARSTVGFYGPLTMGGQASFSIDPSGHTQFYGSLSVSTTDPSLFSTPAAVFWGGTSTAGTSTAAAPQFVEVMGSDQGPVPAGFTGNFACGPITLSKNGYVKLVDQADNAAGTGPEALYADSLLVPAGATVDLNGLHLYVRALQNNGTILNGTVALVPGGGPLPFAAPTAGSLASSGQADAWTFAGHAGGVVTVELNPGTASDPSGSPGAFTPSLDWASVQLLDANNQVLASAADTAAGGILTLKDVALPADGAYTVRVAAATGASQSGGNYVLTAWDATPHVQSLALGTPVTGTITSPYASDQWVFSATAGEKVRFDPVGTPAAGITFSLAGPAGYTGFTDITTDSDLLTLPADGTYVVTARGPTGATGGYGFKVVQTDSIPAVSAFVVGDGTAQRSTVRQLTLTFTSPVTLAPGALTLSRLLTDVYGNAQQGGYDVSGGVHWANPSGDGKAWVATFTPTPTSTSPNDAADGSGSLFDGVYALTIRAASVTDSSGNVLAGGDQVFKFHRLFGDADGNKTVNALDYARFRQAFGSAAGSAAYNPAFDFDGNGTVNALDFAQFKKKFGTTFGY